MNQRHYSKAPIIEAVIDLKVVVPDRIGLEDVASLAQSLQDRFPEKEDLFIDTVEFRPEGAGSNRVHVGFRLRNNETGYVLLLRTDGVGISKLAPYETWDTFQKDARYYWEMYRKACSPLRITRIGLRYINRLDMPIQADMSEFVQLYAAVPTGFQYNEVTYFFMQLQLPQLDIGSLLVLNQMRTEPPSPDKKSIIVDFDLFKEVDWSIDSDKEVWDYLSVLRERKNTLFEACITDKTREIIQ